MGLPAVLKRCEAVMPSKECMHVGHHQLRAAVRLQGAEERIGVLAMTATSKLGAILMPASACRKVSMLLKVPF
jgi:hypothetical protein